MVNNCPERREKSYPTNAELAQMVISYLFAQEHGRKPKDADIRDYHEQMRRIIENSPLDIAEQYLGNQNSLEGVKIHGISPTVKGIIEKILGAEDIDALITAIATESHEKKGREHIRDINYRERKTQPKRNDRQIEEARRLCEEWLTENLPSSSEQREAPNVTNAVLAGWVQSIIAPKASALLASGFNKATLQRLVEIITNSSINISQLFAVEGNLQKLNINGIGPKTEQMLEDLLRCGGINAYLKFRAFRNKRKEEAPWEKISSNPSSGRPPNDPMDVGNNEADNIEDFNERTGN